MVNKLLVLLFLSLHILNFQYALGLEGNNMYKQTIAIDLDGVLNNYKGYTKDIPEIKDGAKEFICRAGAITANVEFDVKHYDCDVRQSRSGA